jgi:hypothetical protein
MQEGAADGRADEMAGETMATVGRLLQRGSTVSRRLHWHRA